ncbi:c-type cytochrome [Azospira sp. APE16]|uniref:Cytochrome c551/c552 n=1 Tax=Azospira oryzae (strain ATCC BAA-33 / DSM 13638 / PS) TaxID=640081 RepID=G8QIW5_AZOOP|nr:MULTISPECIES: c-type cytochrome [Azospira]AEV25333.1 cytochrome c551/c552 [Azospira oryzae PS]MDK9691154.1 c-type cytochrome [Azospira sp.]
MIYRLLMMGLVLSWGAVQAADNSASAARAFCDSGKLAKGAEIAVFRGCLGCHTVDSKRIGPSYQEIAKKYPHTPDVVAQLAKKIRDGGKGNWGELSMPANPVSEAEAQTLAEWVLSLDEPPARYSSNP